MNEKRSEKLEQNSNEEKRLPLWLRWLILVGLIILAIIILFFVIKPLRTYSAQKYITEGDNYLANKQYIHADLSYEKALIIFPGSKTAKERKALAADSSKNIALLQNFYKDNNFNSQKDKLDEASAFPVDETEAVKLSKKLIEEKEYQLAIIPAKTATEMGPDYRDAWLYLGIANLKTAELVDLSVDAKASYTQKAKDAFDQAKKIDPESKIVNDYLNSLDKV